MSKSKERHEPCSASRKDFPRSYTKEQFKQAVIEAYIEGAKELGKANEADWKKKPYDIVTAEQYYNNKYQDK